MRWSVGSRRPVTGKSLVRRLGTVLLGVAAVIATAVAVTLTVEARNQIFTATDPGPRSGPPWNVGGMFTTGLTTADQGYFNDGSVDFNNTYVVPCSTGGCTTGQGLGPVFNENQCSSCHAAPVPGGGAPSSNPVFSVYQLLGARNTMPWFESQTGPVLVPRFPFLGDNVTPDDTVHQLFTIAGRSDAQQCSISQPTWPTTPCSGSVSTNCVALHQPLPVFGDGFLELYDNTTLTSNMSAVCALTQFGICGTPNISGNDGSVLRLGWKAQWRGLTLAAGEELNVESGVTNEFFPTELNQTSGCQLNPIPESGTNFTASPTGRTGQDQFVGAPTRMALFVRFLASPTSIPLTPNDQTGQAQFLAIGCANCHSYPGTSTKPGSDPNMTTPASSVTALSNKSPNAYTDLLLHHMGSCLADGLTLGSAQGDMFRTPPLWGAGYRLFFLHDGREANLYNAIEDHFCLAGNGYPASEANTVINNFNALQPALQQDILNFIRAL